MARATVRPPTPESKTPIGARIAHARSPPQRLRDALLGALDLGRPGVGRQVLPPAVGEQAHDVALVELARDPLGRRASTAPEEMPAKIPSRSVSSRVARSASEEFTRNFRSSTVSSKIGGTNPSSSDRRP